MKKDVENMMQLDRVAEAVTYLAEKKKQGEYTISDYYAIPEDVRAELIDGVIYDMAPPLSVHQLLSAKIHGYLARYIEKKGGSCIPFFAPIGVQLDKDDKTIFICINATFSKLEEGYKFGRTNVKVILNDMESDANLTLCTLKTSNLNALNEENIESNLKEPNLSTLKSISESLNVPLPILFFLSMTEDDVQPNKRKAFQIVSPSVKSLVNEFFAF